MARLSAEETRVTFVIRCDTKYGQRLRIVGDHVALGGWDPLRGIELTTSVSDHPTWRISVTLPANHRFQYKYVCMAAADPNDPSLENSFPLPPEPSPDLVADAQVDYWESFEDNRIVDTVSGATMVVDEGVFGELNNQLPNRVRTLARVLTPRHSKEKDLDREGAKSGETSPISVGAEPDGAIIALYRLPIVAERDPETGRFTFSWDDDALYLTSAGLRRGLEEMNIKPLWIGIINTEEPIPPKERDAVSKTLLDDFNCVPVFLQQDIRTNFYQGFCKGTLWPTFHMLNIVNDSSGNTKQFNDAHWHAYQRVNRVFSQVIVEHYEGHLIWVQDYHLMLLPYYLRLKLSGVKIGFYLHIPWPSSEIFRMLPVRTEILRGLLSATILGFHLFDYARHFLSACVRLLNLEHEAAQGSLGIEYEGRHVMIRVSHIGVDPERFAERLGLPHVRHRAAEYEALYPGKTILGAIDDLDVIKGISLKLIAFENYLELSDPKVRNNVALIQVVLPKAARVQEAVRKEIRDLVDRINSTYGTADHQPVHYIEKTITFDERIAIYSVCDALLLTPIRDGLNLIPYEYLVSTPQGKGQLILSEFTGCSRALSSAVRVNPWNVAELRDVIDNAIQKREARAAEIRLKHEADRKYVTVHSSALWAESFFRDLRHAVEQVKEVVRLGLSRAGGQRSLHFEGFTMLNSREVVKAFRDSTRRLFLFDYDGTLTQIESETSHMAHTWARPSETVLRNLELLAKQENCTVVILSGRGTDTEGFDLPQMKSLGIAAEHGFYYRRPGSDDWEELAPGADVTWIETAYRLMQLYTERTDGSYIEEKSAGLVWHYLAADPEFGGWQAKEMHDHLESILIPFDVQVVNGHGWLQVRLAQVNKGKMVEKLVKELDEPPDFVLCCGDDRSDEDMFTVLTEDERTKNSQLFTATVGVKPSNARYYLRSPMDLANLIEGIIEIALPGSATHVRSSTLEDMRPAAIRRLAEEGLTHSNSSSALNEAGVEGTGRQSLES